VNPFPITWHDQLEKTHAAGTGDELSTAFGEPTFNEERFLTAGVTVLGAVAARLPNRELDGTGFWKEHIVFSMMATSIRCRSELDSEPRLWEGARPLPKDAHHPRGLRDS